MSSILQAGFGFSTAATSLVTTAETALVTSGLVVATTNVEHVVVIAHFAMTTGVGTTGYTARLRRGSGVGGAILGNPQLEAASASQIRTVMEMVEEDQILLGEIQYTITVQQAAATGNGTVNEATILVVMLS